MVYENHKFEMFKIYFFDIYNQRVTFYQNFNSFFLVLNVLLGALWPIVHVHRVMDKDELFISCL